MRISDWSSDVCSSDLHAHPRRLRPPVEARRQTALQEFSAAHVGAARTRSCASGACPGSAMVRRQCSAQETGGDLEGYGEVSAKIESAMVMAARSEEHTSELQSLMRISYAVFCLKKHKTHAVTRVIQRIIYQ